MERSREGHDAADHEPLAADSDHPGRFWHMLPDGRMQCDVCPRDCQLRDGQRGMCFVRRRVGNEMHLTTYGRSSGFCVDPIEKKPLNHFYPGTSVLSFGTAGCNLACKFCQNWDISKARDMDKLADQASPAAIAAAAVRAGCKSVAFTYNDPTIFLEYAADVADACREQGIHPVSVTAGYIHAEARKDLYRHIDAANVDLKAFTEEFYAKVCAGHLEPVKDTLRYLVRETSVWTEITTLLIPGQNDGDDEIQRLSDWVLTELGPDVPLHFTAFHPDYRMLDVPATPYATVRRARELAKRTGLHHVYTGNVHDSEGGTTYCTGCGTPLIERDWYDIRRYEVDASGACPKCHKALAGRYEAARSRWGRRRMPVVIGA